jgi:GDPmannose 4,6-dehydratase
MNYLSRSKKIDNVNIVNIEDVVIPTNSTVVFISGVTGQDGSLMVDYLLKETDYTIVGGVRRLSVYNHTNIKHITSTRFILVNFDLGDTQNIALIVQKLNPSYFINFAAQSFVGSSWDFPRYTWTINSTSVLDILESIRRYNPTCRMYQAGSSEEFGDVQYCPQDEKHPLKPRSPYGASKAASRQIIKVYRDTYNLYAIQGWLFNHEGTRRGEEFVSRKITKNVAKIYHALTDKTEFVPLELGNVDALRDWSDAEDFVRGVWMMLNQDIYNKNYTTPKEYIMASGETHTVKEFVELAFKEVGIDSKWIGEKLDRRLVLSSDEEVTLCVINPKFYRPAEVDDLCGNSDLIRNDLKWLPQILFTDLVKKMVRNDML